MFVDADDLLGEHATVALVEALRDSDACLACGRAARYGSDDVLDLEFAATDPPAVRLDAPLRPTIRSSMFGLTRFFVRTGAVMAVGGCNVFRYAEAAAPGEKAYG